jgi:hypothetical protein
LCVAYIETLACLWLMEKCVRIPADLSADTRTQDVSTIPKHHSRSPRAEQETVAAPKRQRRPSKRKEEAKETDDILSELAQESTENNPRVSEIVSVLREEETKCSEVRNHEELPYRGSSCILPRFCRSRRNCVDAVVCLYRAAQTNARVNTQVAPRVQVTRKLCRMKVCRMKVPTRRPVTVIRSNPRAKHPPTCS